MFKVKDNKEIGAYFARLVEEKVQKSMRQFGKACLELQNKPTDETALNDMANKLFQIKQGRKGIQLTDLPVYTHLLGVTSPVCRFPLSCRLGNLCQSGRQGLSQLRRVWKKLSRANIGYSASLVISIAYTGSNPFRGSVFKISVSIYYRNHSYLCEFVTVGQVSFW